VVEMACTTCDVCCSNCKWTLNHDDDDDDDDDYKNAAKLDHVKQKCCKLQLLGQTYKG